MSDLPRYFLADWDEESGQSMEEWAAELAEQGWRVWSGPGCWFNLNGHRVWRVSLRQSDVAPASHGLQFGA